MSKVAGLALFILALSCVHVAYGATRWTAEAVSAPGACQAALPAYEGQIRKRPLAIANEGTQAAFVSCSLPGNSNALDTDYFGVALRNTRPVGIIMQCTLIEGLDSPVGADPEYHSKQIALAPGAHAVLSWDKTEAGGNMQAQVNLSCLIAPGVQIGMLYINHEVDVGA